MKTKLLMQAAVAAATIGAFSSSHALRIDTDGAGGTAGVIEIGGIDPAPGNSIATCVACIDGQMLPVTSAVGPGSGTVGSILQVYGHSAIGGFTDDVGDGVGSLGYGFNHNWTLSFGFQEQIITDTVLGSVAETSLAVVGSSTTTNWFEIYYDPAQNDTMLTGQGFDNGTLILSGTILPAAIPLPGETGVTDFTGSVANLPGQLDQFGNDNYGGLGSITGNGGGQIEIQITSQDFNFILDPINTLIIDVSTQFIDPFSQTNPSSCFDDTAAGVAAGAVLAGSGADFEGAGSHVDNAGGNPYTDCLGTALAAGGSVGPINGLSGPNIMFQTDANISVPVVVPEPTTLALMGLGLAGLGYRRKANKA